MTSEVTVLIYTRNNERDISEAVASAQLLSPYVLVADMDSQDNTAAYAKKAGAMVIQIPVVEYVEQVRMRAIRHIKTAWIFILDADERITPELADEIRTILLTDNHSNYRIPRRNIFAHTKWLQHGGWWPDHQTRLIQVSALRDWPAIIHSTPTILGTSGTLNNPMLHYFHGDLEGMATKTIKYEAIESDLLYTAGRHASVSTFFRKYFGELNRRLVKHSGWKDGWVGVVESIYQSYSKTITYLYVYEKKIKSGGI